MWIVQLALRRPYTFIVSNIEHVESQTLAGLGVSKVFFPGTPLDEIVGWVEANVQPRPLSTGA